jgi:hypothetical protein
MDSIPYSTIADADVCFVIDTGEDFHVFRWESSETTNESSPWTTNKVVEADDDGGAATGRWVLCDWACDDLLIYGDCTVTGTLTLSGSLSTAGFTSTGNIVIDDGANITFDNAPASDHNTAGVLTSYTAGESLVFGDFCYVKVDGKLWKADADAAATLPIVAMAAATIAGDAAGNFLTYGWARDDTWAWTVGGIVYASTTAGALTQTQPSGNGDQVQAVGVATHADRIFFSPALTVVEVSA